MNQRGESPAFARRRRESGCLSDLALDRLTVGEASVEETARAQAHLSTCDVCSEAQSRLALARESFLADANLGALASDALARASQTRVASPWWRRLVPAVGVCVAAAGGFALWAHGTHDDRRTKGSLSMAVYVKHLEHPEAGGVLHLGEPLHPGDRLRLEIDSDKPGQVAVLAVDTSGQVSVYYPAGPRTTALAAHTREPLPNAVELDDRLGGEVIVALRCAEPLDIEAAVAATRRAVDPARVAADPSSALGKLGLPCAETRYAITKVPGDAPP